MNVESNNVEIRVTAKPDIVITSIPESSRIKYTIPTFIKESTLINIIFSSM
jgi:hypothetical protein